MEAVLIPFSPDQSMSAYNQIRTPKRNFNNRFTCSRPSQNFASSDLLHLIHGSFFRSPSPSLSSSSYSSYAPNSHQPPLLPLPHQNRTFSSSPTNRKLGKAKDEDLASKKPKSPSNSRKSSRSPPTKAALIIASTNRLGPDPSDLPKEVSRVLKSSSLQTPSADHLEKFSGSVFSLAPPPSSLPLPKFSLRPKASCNVEAAGCVDAGATDDLRRLLRIR